MSGEESVDFYRLAIALRLHQDHTELHGKGNLDNLLRLDSVCGTEASLVLLRMFPVPLLGQADVLARGGIEGNMG